LNQNSKMEEVPFEMTGCDAIQLGSEKEMTTVAARKIIFNLS